MRWSSGDYQIAPIAARSTAMGRWRLTPPGYGGDTACGRETIRCGGTRVTPHPSRLRRATCLPAGRFAGLTRHRRVIQYRGPLKGKANGGTPFNAADPPGGRLGRCAARGEDLTLRRGREKKEPPCGRLPFLLQRFLPVRAAMPVRDRRDRTP